MTLLLVGLIGAGIAIAVWLLLPPERAAASTTSDALGPRAGPSSLEKAAGHQLRNEIGDLIQRGRIHQTNLLSIAEGHMPDVQKRAGALAVATMEWHVQVIRFFQNNVSHADAMLVSAPPPHVGRPTGLIGNINYGKQDGKSYGGYDLRASWDAVVADLAALEKTLERFPAL